MTVFLASAALMCLAACFLLMWPGVARRARAIAPEQLLAVRAQHAELQRLASQGTLAPADFEKARLDLGRRLLEQVVGATGPAQATALSRATAVALTVFVPLVAAALYWQVGTPQALTGETAQMASGEGNPHGGDGGKLQAQIRQLEQKLAETPDDPRGWAMLGRSHTVMGNYPEAAKAYARAAKLAPRDASMLIDFADVLAMAQGRKLDGEPLRLIDQALKLDPDNIKGLLLAGTAAFEAKDYGKAVALWGRVPKLAPDDTALLTSLQKSIDEARALGGLAAQAPQGPALAAAPVAAGKGTADTVAKGGAAAGGPGAEVRGRVSLAAAMAGKANPEDTVFIFARAAQGPKMPLAVIRKKVKDLPMDFVLDDSMAMAPSMKLSGFPEIVVTARVSKSGDPVPKPGDLQGVSAAIKLGGAPLKLEISELVP
jgi:cytochrome c-type biogenesis protein CcmH